LNRHRLLLAGPPGNGKTSVAEAIASELMLPFYVVRYEGVVSNFLGEAAARLDSAFEFARTRRCVVFFDELDTIAKERSDAHETGEIKRVVSTLLLQIDRLPAHVLFVGATNHSELLDRAAWRRFQIRADLEPPTRSQATRATRATRATLLTGARGRRSDAIAGQEERLTKYLFRSTLCSDRVAG
jgi:SpoVK/Ycf46/Vps4 family AAA+-type ATPase